jgi:ADP-dependent NAD(P)H-hydrate dehydratase / NAD(P)H-hydrate epimerase
MQKIFYEVNSLDKKCYEQFHLSEDILMEHASLSMARFIENNFKEQSSVLIVCGSGNNGADGIALARLLLGKYHVFLYTPYELKSAMAKLQQKRTHALGIKTIEQPLACDIVVDCLFGTGLNKTLDEFTVKLIRKLNEYRGYKIACDIPSGITKDGHIVPICFKANTTITMGALKSALFADGVKDFVGNIEVASLGVHSRAYEEESDIFLLDKLDIEIPFRLKNNTHKGDFGHLGVIVGEKKGAGVLACDAAFNFGCSLVTAITHENITLPYHIMQCHKLPHNTTAIALGMGLGNYESQEIKELLNNTLPKVIDADLFYDDIILEALKENSVITPHPKEFCSLLKRCDIADITVEELQKNRFKYALMFSAKYPKVVLYLKGANAIVGYEMKLYINSFGTSALSKGGSGDVLAGLIASLLAQGYTPLNATISASLAHSMAACLYEGNNYSLTPQDLIAQIKRL